MAACPNWRAALQQQHTAWQIVFAYLKVVPEELVIQLGDLELVGFLSVHDPGTALALRVHQDRVPGGPGHHDAILYTQVVCGQSLKAAEDTFVLC